LGGKKRNCPSEDFRKPKKFRKKMGGEGKKASVGGGKDLIRKRTERETNY